MTLFDDYPDAATRRRRREGCCPQWNNLAEHYPRLVMDRSWPLVVLHEMAHSRVPFSVRRFSLDAGLPMRIARSYIDQAREWEWIDVAPLEVEPELHDETGESEQVDLISTTRSGVPVKGGDDATREAICWDSLWLGRLSKKR